MRRFCPLPTPAALSLSLAVGLALQAAPAEAYRARNGLAVEPLGAQEFRVPYGGQSGAAAFWCAAGDFAQRGLGLAATGRIWRLTPVPRGSGEAMEFSTRPDDATDSTGLVILFGRKDASLTVAAALNYCRRADG